MKTVASCPRSLGVTEGGVLCDGDNHQTSVTSGSSGIQSASNLTKKNSAAERTSPIRPLSPVQNYQSRNQNLADNIMQTECDAVQNNVYQEAGPKHKRPACVLDEEASGGSEVTADREDGMECLPLHIGPNTKRSKVDTRYFS